MITTAKPGNITNATPGIKTETKRVKSINLLGAPFIVLPFRTHDLFDIVPVPCHGFGDLSKTAVTINKNI